MMQVDVVLPAALAHVEMRPYQREGLAWLDFLRRSGLHGVLADDMGLGKTLQTTAIIAGQPPVLLCMQTLWGIVVTAQPCYCSRGRLLGAAHQYVAFHLMASDARPRVCCSGRWGAAGGGRGAPPLPGGVPLDAGAALGARGGQVRGQGGAAHTCLPGRPSGAYVIGGLLAYAVPTSNHITPAQPLEGCAP
jgi:SNF2-related domain